MSVSRLLPAFLVFACSADPIPSGRYLITTGQESDTYTMSPAPVKFETSKVDSNNAVTQLVTSEKPIDSIDVGLTGTYFFQLQGTDADNQPRVEALSYYVAATDLAGYDVQLFAGRTDAFCRPAGNLANGPGDHPPVGIFWGQILWITGATTNSAIVGEGYDLFSWSPVAQATFLTNAACPFSPCTFRSIANYAGPYGLAIGATWAITVDVQNESIATASLPAGLTSWADVSGGRTVNAPTGASFVVGPTRTDTASSYVLQLATDGNIYSKILAVPRLGAAATYIKDHGLLISGGDASLAATNPGVEFLSETGTDFVGIPYAADAVTGAALVPEITGTRVWRVGGRNSDNTPAPTLVYDVACTSNCTPDTMPAFDLDVTNAQGFKFNKARIVIGETSDGTMVAWRLTDAAPIAIPLREPRKNSSVYSLPNGFAALIGGTLVSDGTPATSIELVAY